MEPPKYIQELLLCFIRKLKKLSSLGKLWLLKENLKQRKLHNVLLGNDGIFEHFQIDRKDIRSVQVFSWKNSKNSCNEQQHLTETKLRTESRTYKYQFDQVSGAAEIKLIMQRKRIGNNVQRSILLGILELPRNFEYVTVEMDIMCHCDDGVYRGQMRKQQLSPHGKPGGIKLVRASKVNSKSSVVCQFAVQMEPKHGTSSDRSNYNKFSQISYSKTAFSTHVTSSRFRRSKRAISNRVQFPNNDSPNKPELALRPEMRGDPTELFDLANSAVRSFKAEMFAIDSRWIQYISPLIELQQSNAKSNRYSTQSPSKHTAKQSPLYQYLCQIMDPQLRNDAVPPGATKMSDEARISKNNMFSELINEFRQFCEYPNLRQIVKIDSIADNLKPHIFDPVRNEDVGGDEKDNEQHREDSAGKWIPSFVKLSSLFPNVKEIYFRNKNLLLYRFDNVVLERLIECVEKEYCDLEHIQFIYDDLHDPGPLDKNLEKKLNDLGWLIVIPKNMNADNKFIIQIGHRHAILKEERYSKVKPIGFGSFGVVWKATDAKRQEPNNLVALKVVDLTELSLKTRKPKNEVRDVMKNEIEIMRKLSHKHIVDLLDDFEDDDGICLVLEYCSGGNLARFLSESKTLAEKDAQKFAKQIWKGLLYLQDQRVTHRDLKPDNIMLSERTTKATVLIADFGLSKIKDTGAVTAHQSYAGTPLFMAPEMLQKRAPYRSNVDLWSFGCVLYEMVAGFGKHPFLDEGKREADALIKSIEAKSLNLDGLKVDEDCKQLLHELLEKDPEKRIWEKPKANKWLK